MTFPPNKILRLSDDVLLTYDKPLKTTPIQYQYIYDNGILKGKSISYTEDEIKKQLNNYWVCK